MTRMNPPHAIRLFNEVERVWMRRLRGMLMKSVFARIPKEMIDLDQLRDPPSVHSVVSQVSLQQGN